MSGYVGRRWWALFSTLCVVGILLPACGGGGGSSGSADEMDDSYVTVVAMALVDRNGDPTGATGTTNVYRNNRIQLTYSAYIDPDSVSDRTIQIGIPSAGNLFLQAVGRYTTDGNRVTFDPTVTSTGSPHPFGFEADSTYSLLVKGHPNPKTVVSLEGRAVVADFTTTFMTTDLYLPDLDQPSMISVDPEGLDSNTVAELLQLTPEERVADNTASGRWDDVWVDSRSDIVVEFSEAMLPATINTQSTFRVVNLDRGGREVFGVFRYSDDAKTVTFRPTFGYGRGPYLIRVTLTVDITDLAGNPISNPRELIFLTEDDPTAVNEGLIEEYFEDTIYEDATFMGPNGEARAHWNAPQDPGMLASIFGVSTVKIPANQQASAGVFPPIGTGTWANSRAQCIYTGTEVSQSAGTITQVYWHSYPSYTASGNVWSGLTVRLGMTTLSLLTATFASNYNVGSPVSMASNVSYTVPQNNGNTYLQLPTTNNFSYNGQDGIIIDIAKTSSTASSNAAWSFIYGTAGRYVYGTPSTATSGSRVTYWVFTQFGFRTEHSMAQSLWYRTDSEDPMYLDVVVSPTDQPAGTIVELTYQGAADDGTGGPDPTTFSPLTDDVTELDGYEYLRFRVKFTANLASGVGPKLDEILIPYIFF